MYHNLSHRKCIYVIHQGSVLGKTVPVSTCMDQGRRQRAQFVPSPTRPRSYSKSHNKTSRVHCCRNQSDCVIYRILPPHAQGKKNKMFQFLQQMQSAYFVYYVPILISVLLSVFDNIKTSLHSVYSASLWSHVVVDD